MKRLPWFRWWAMDQEHDNFYRSLNDQEHSFFHRCLNYDWINGGLPKDLNKLARLLGKNPRTVRKLWPKVSSAFQAEFNGNWTSIQLELERNSARKIAQVGLESAQRRWVPNANHNHNHNQNQNKHYVNSETVRQRKPKNPSTKENKSKGDGDFDQGIEEPREGIGGKVHRDYVNGRISFDEAMRRMADNDSEFTH